MNMNDLRISGVDAIKEAMDTYSSSNSDFFSIDDDGKIAQVRFAHGDDKDLDIFVVHKVQLAGKDRYIACLAPLKQECPLCKAGHKPQVRLFLSLEDMRDGKKKIWDRGKTEIPNILGLVSRYGRLDSRLYEIQRHGKKGDKETTYQYFPLDPIPQSIAPLTREPICSENGFILLKSADEITKLLGQIGTPTQGGNYRYQAQGGGQPGKMF